MGPDASLLNTVAGAGALRSGIVRAGAFLVALAFPASVSAQVEPLRPPPGSADTVPAASQTALPDSLRVVNLPERFDPLALREERTGVWVWDRSGIYLAPGLTLADLLRDIPGLRVVQGGDYGAPTVPAAFSATAGRVRVIQDGIELVPLDGDVIDLSLVGLAGLERVRVERAPGGVEIALTGRRSDDPRPYTQIEAGTGDLNTNFFRGTFALPRAPGGSLLFSIDRVDTRGRSGEDRGRANGVLARYTLSPSERFGAEVTLLKRSAGRSVYLPAERDRTDWMARVRAAPREDLSLGLFAASSSLSTGDSSTTPGVRQVGVDAAWVSPSVHAGGSVRRLDGEGLPSWTLEGDLTLAHPQAGGASVRVRHESWEGQSALRTRGALWTARLYGLSGFAEIDRGPVGVPSRGIVAADDSLFGGFGDAPRFLDERSARRIGAAFENRGVVLRGARLSIEADSIARYGLAFDRGVSRVAGGTRAGWEAEAQIPLLVFDGLSLRGGAVLWDDEAPWPYASRLQYDARLRFHDTFLPTGNFELLVEGGVREREPMSVFTPETGIGSPASLSLVPFQQSWFARLHIRIVSVQLFLHWENLTLRRGNLDFPDRLLPLTRAVYGVRWGLWN